MRMFDKIHQTIKYKAFGKITVGRKPIDVKRKTKKEESKEDEAKAIFEEEVKRTSAEMNEI